MISPSSVISKLRSGCSAQNAENSSSVIGAAVKVAGRYASLIKNDIFYSVAPPPACYGSSGSSKKINGFPVAESLMPSITIRASFQMAV